MLALLSNDNSATNGGFILKKPEKLPPSTDENEVLRRMLRTPPKPHGEMKKKAPAKKPKK
jgi:hypothetical protein